MAIVLWEGQTPVKYMGSKNRIAKDILPIMLAERGMEKLFRCVL